MIKPSLYMDVLTSRVNTQAVLGEVDRLVKSGKPDDRKKAIALEPKLAKALANEQAAIESYMQALRGQTMNRAAFQQLSPAQRMNFIRAGGKISS